jgi:hypothetical protein
MRLYFPARYGCTALGAMALVAVGCTTSDSPRDEGGRQFVSADPAADAAKGDRPVVMASDDLEFLVANSPLVFFGEVVEQESFLDAGRDLIVTRNVFAIKEVIVGDFSQDTLTLNLLGGAVGDRVMMVSHLPRFEEGGSYVVFTDPARTTYNPVTANEHGVFRVDPSTERVYGAGGFAVTGVEETRLVFGAERLPARGEQTAPAGAVAEQPETSGGIVGLRPAPRATLGAITYDRFAAAIRRVADAR